MTAAAEPASPQGTGLVKLTSSGVARAVDVLCRAFAADPFVDWVVRSDAKRDEGMRRFFSVCLRQLTLPYGEVCTTEDFSGIAMWTPPSRFKVALPQQLHFLYQAVRGMQLRHVGSRIAGFNEIERRHPTAPHYYLFFLGVDPDRQGEGIGTQMMTSMLERCDTERMPAYLEATTEELLRFYSRLGYRALDPIALGHGGPTMHPMWRDPGDEETRV